MSGGFFRGTSADQDTRFSNKQAKLLKSQKFPAELEHLVDMTKVKMDVLRPWIAARATELLGFEDEVLINFVYGLLDGKAVDGKKIQIQLTGFMEKNTGKFMKELWGLLLSAQNNVSGVPQQFLDAKEEETRKKKEETDRIASEIQKRREKEGREPERGRKSRFEGEADILRSVKDAPDLILSSSKARSSSLQPEEEREVNGKHDSRAINGRRASPTGSNKRSISRSRSDSGNDLRSSSVSMPSQSQRRSASLERQSQSPTRRSLSPERRYKSPSRRSISPRRRYSPRITRSPSRRRSPRLRQRSASRSRRRSPSPYRQRSPRSRQRSSPSLRRRSPSISRRRSPSPLRRRSPSPLRRRSPSPLRRRSPTPVRRRSPTPVRRRSPTPVRRRSPSPLRHRSPVKDRRRSPSPFRRRSPMRRRSPSPWRRSPLRRSPKHRRRSPLRSPKRHPAESQYSPQQRKRSRSPYKSRSPLYRARRSLSTERDSHAIRRRDEYTSRRELEKRSPVDHGLDRKITERSGSGHKASVIAYRKVPISLRSPQRDIGNQNEVRDKVPAATTEDSPSQSESPVNMRKIKPRTNRRSPILSKSPSRKARIRSPLHDSPGTSRDEEQTGHAREDSHDRIDSHKRDKNSPGELGLKKFYIDDLGPERHSTDRVVIDQSPAAHGRPVHLAKSSGQRSDVDLPERNVQQISYSSDDIEYGPGSIREDRGSRGNVHDIQRSGKLHPKDASSLEERAHNVKEAGDGVNVGKRPRPRNEEHREPHHNTESITRSKRRADKRNQHDSDSVETDSDKYHIREKPRHKKTDKRKKDSDDSSSSDSQVDDRKEAKRRRRDEKRLRKEERRRRREERHRKRLERRASKEKVHSVDMVNPPSDFEKNHNDSDDSDVAGMRKNIHPNDADETESEQKKLEIELRKKALESLRAKKAISH